MHSRISSSVSLIAGISFTLFVILLFSLFVGCRSETEVSGPGDSAPDPVASVAPEIEPATRVVVTAPTEPRLVTYAEAETAYKNGSYSDAVKLFSLYSEQKPENPWGPYMLGLSAFKVGAFEMSQNAFEAALELDPKHQKSLLNLARVFLSTERADEALDVIDKAREIDGSVPDVHRLKGRALHALSQLTEAADAYRDAIRIDNRDAWSMNNLALVLIDEGFHELAISPLARAVELNPDVAVFFNNLGMALEHTGQFRDAETAYASALEVDASYTKAIANLSRVQTVDQDIGLTTVDMLAMAQDFVEEIDSWSDESIAREVPIAVAAIDSSSAIAVPSDSTTAQDR